MCGIAGIVRWREAASPDVVRGMVSALAHRGPDDEGVLCEGGVGIGMRRLSILDLSAAGRQPMTSDDGAVSIVFNGEIYSHLDLRSRLVAEGQTFRGSSDTETLLRAYQRLGVDGLVRSISGMYAFAILDRRKKKLVLARDEFGIKPLYLRRAAGQISFASEIRALARDGGGRPAPDARFLDAYLQLGWVPSPRTAFSGVSKLDPGTILEIDLADGAEESRRFYRLTPEVLEPFPVDDGGAGLLEMLRERMNWVIRRQLLSDVPVGVFLSGGLDSSAILTMAAPHLGSRPRSFSIGFRQSDRGDEVAAARMVARGVNSEHVVLTLDSNTLDDLAQIQGALEEPISDSAVVPLWHLCQGTAPHVKVALSGEGGDESLGGYNRYFWGYAAATLGRVPGVGDRLGAVIPQLTQRTHGLLNLVRRAGKFAETVALPEPERYMRWFELFSPAERRELGAREEGAVGERVHRLFADASALGLDVVQRMQFVDISLMLLDNLLVKADKLSMAHGLEVRVPLLDRKLVELGLGLPIGAKIGLRGNKSLLRKLLSERLPRAITRGSKRGFELPVDAWFRNAQTAGLRDRLKMGALVGRLGLSGAAIGRLVDRHVGGEDLGRKMFTLAMLETWAELHA